MARARRLPNLPHSFRRLCRPGDPPSLALATPDFVSRPEASAAAVAALTLRYETEYFEMNHLTDQQYLCKATIGDRPKETVVGVPHHGQFVFVYFDNVSVRFGERTVVENNSATSFLVTELKGQKL